MPGLFSRVKTWILQEDLASADLNGEFNNIINNMGSDLISGDSASVGQMQTMVNPGTVGGESLASNISGEIERLRYVIQRIMGASSPQWYSAPPTDLSTLAQTVSNSYLFRNGVISGAVDANGQPMYLIPDGTTNKITLKCSITPLTAYINGTLTTFNSDITLTGLTLAPGASNTATIGNGVDGAALASNATTKNSGEDDSPDIIPSGLAPTAILNYLPLSTPGSALTAKDKLPIAFKLNGEYSTGVLRGTATRIENCQRGIFFDSASSSLARAGFATADTVTLMNLTWVFLLAGGTLDICYTKPQEGGNAPASTASGDYWYDTVNQSWKKYSGTAWNANASIYVGICFQNNTATIGAKSADFLNTYSRDQNIRLRRDSVDYTKLTSDAGGTISVYGKTISFAGITLDFSVARDAPIAPSGSDLVFFYLKPNGTQYVDTLAPNKREDLGGYYHPSKPFRCLASGSYIGGRDSDIVNLKDVTAVRTRLWGISFASSTSTSVTPTTIKTFNVVLRGGRIRCYLLDNDAATFTGNANVVNSGSNKTVAALLANVIDEQDNVGESFMLGTLVSETGAKAHWPLASLRGQDSRAPVGFTTVNFQTGVPTQGSGTGTLTLTAAILVLEEFF